MGNHNKKEKDLVKKVNDFLDEHKITLYVISRGIGYHNVEKLEDFFKHDSGTLTLKIAGRIEKFINEYKPKK